ncbi:MAG: hypothetical protein HY961_06855 [Ignavibacteriae bacterium]|nr:hypothetical protein [Ignavibacteriota bacterium]
MIEKIDSSQEAVRKTGKAFLIGFSIIAAVLFLANSGWFQFDFQRGAASNGWKWFLGAAVVLFGLSRVAYPIMKPIHIGWMTLAFALGWLNTRILLSLFFYLILTPIGLMMRVFGKDFLDERIDRSASTYWKKRDLSTFDPKHIERRF